MTVKEAIKIIGSDYEFCGSEERIAIDMAIKALQKQKPQKPIIRHYEDPGEVPYIKYACPSGCKIQLRPVTKRDLACEHQYCPKCGQRIDWTEQEENNDRRRKI